jgi:hypothetical protein
MRVNKCLPKSEISATYFLFTGSKTWRFETSGDNAARETMERDDGERREEEPG